MQSLSVCAESQPLTLPALMRRLPKTHDALRCTNASAACTAASSLPLVKHVTRLVPNSRPPPSGSGQSFPEQTTSTRLFFTTDPCATESTVPRPRDPGRMRPHVHGSHSS